MSLISPTIINGVTLVATALTPVVILLLYIKLNDSRLGGVPSSVLYFSPKRVKVDDVWEVDKKMRDRLRVEEEEEEEERNASSNLDADAEQEEGEIALTTKTGRRYIVVGGGGFLGGWIATQLLQRGEDPRNIRILDINAPINHVPRNAMKQGLEFIKTDVTDERALEDAFLAPWSCSRIDTAPGSTSSSPTSPPPSPPPLTVFHTAANIRFYERTERHYPRSSAVNVVGTQNVINACLKAGADVLVYTSSGSVGVKSGCYLTAPWQSEVGDHFVQVVDDTFDAGDQPSGFGIRGNGVGAASTKSGKSGKSEVYVPYGIRDKSGIRTNKGRTNRKLEDFFSNYAASKLSAERLVRDANKTPTGEREREGKRFLHTGCLRPGNGVYGPRGDILCGAYLARGTNPTWVANVVQSFVYVENVVEAHLCYERRLIEASDLESTAANYSKPARRDAFRRGDEGHGNRERVIEGLEQQKLKLKRGGTNNMPDVSGQAFCIADPGAPVSFGDVYVVLETLSDGVCHFPFMSATFMLLLAYLFEAWYIAQQTLAAKLRYASQNAKITAPSRFIAGKLLRGVERVGLSSTLVNLQPSLFSLTSAHLVFDDSRARMAPAKGGLGYKGRHDTLEGLWKTWEEWDRDRREAERVVSSGDGGVNLDLKAKSTTAGVSMSFGWFGGSKKASGRPVGPVEIRKVQ